MKLIKVNPAHPRAKARGFVEGLQNVPFIPRLKSGAFRMGGVNSSESQKGEFALIKEDKIIDVFDTKIDAIRQGYERFGNVPFFVKQIIEIDIPHNFTTDIFA